MAQRRSSSALHLHEEILLLALRDEKGTLESRAGMFMYGIGGAILTELLLQKRIHIEDGRKKLVDVVGTTSLNDDLLDEALELIAAAKRRRSATNWVARIARMKNIKHRVAEGLCRRGVLRDSEDKILLIFKRRIYPTINPTPERRLVERLDRAIFGGGVNVSPKTAVLIALARATGLLAVHFPRKRLKLRKQRLDAIVNGDLVSRATREAVQAAQAAVAAAVVAASTAATIH